MDLPELYNEGLYCQIGIRRNAIEMRIPMTYLHVSALYSPKADGVLDHHNVASYRILTLTETL